MKLKLLVLAAVATMVAGAAFAGGGASAQAPGPSAGTVLAAGLLQPKGIAFGSDGMLYVAESGTGGDTEVSVGEGDEAFTIRTGLTGRVSRIDPDTGARETVADGLPSGAGGPGGPDEALGPADVAFIGSTLYYLQTHGGEEWGFPETPTGIYRIDSSGDAHLVADIGAFNKANPPEAITSGVQVDVEPGGNPYAMDVRSGVFYVSDGNHNRLLRVTTGGSVTAITEFPDHPVSTGLDFGPDNKAYVGHLGQGPFFPEDGKVVSVDLSTGEITEVASGQSWITDVEFGPDGQLYALQFNDEPALSDDSVGPFKATLLTVNADGTMSPLVTGLSFATFLEFDGDTAYVSHWSVTPMGEILKIENFSSVEPPAPAPTAAATQAPATTPTPGGGTIGAPDTGAGSTAGGNNSPLIVLALLAAAGVALAMAGAHALSRRGK